MFQVSLDNKVRPCLSALRRKKNKGKKWCKIPSLFTEVEAEAKWLTPLAIKIRI